MTSSWTESDFLSRIERFRAGDDSALNQLLNIANSRLTLLTRRMLHQFPRVKRWEETDDVLQNSLVRLLRALRQKPPDSLRRFYGLASLQIRRELIDLARHYYGPEGIGANHSSRANANGSRHKLEPSDSTFDPAKLSEWCELHAHIDSLETAEREIVDLVFYQGLNQQQAADLLGINVRTVQRRWHAALLTMHQLLQSEGD